MTPELKEKLLFRLAQPEDQWNEKKESCNEQKVRRTIVAFANSVNEGEFGVLFIGAAENGNHPGLKNADETQLEIYNYIDRCYPKIEYTPYPLEVEVDGVKRLVLAILVPYS